MTITCPYARRSNIESSSEFEEKKKVQPISLAYNSE